jgi:hypothetical protein
MGREAWQEARTAARARSQTAVPEGYIRCQRSPALERRPPLEGSWSGARSVSLKPAMEPSDGQPRSSVAFRLGFAASERRRDEAATRDHIVRKVQWVSPGRIRK